MSLSEHADSGNTNGESLIVCLGSNSFSQLGFNNGKKRYSKSFPTVFGGIDGFNHKNLRDIQCGSQFTVLLTLDGIAYTCGTVNGNVMYEPTLISLPRINIQSPSSLPKISSIACGRKHILMLCSHGFVYSFGTGFFGQLGHGNDMSFDQPKPIENLLNKKVVRIFAGANHSCVITENNEVYMWGLNKSGQCGHPISSECVLSPRILEMTDNVKSLIDKNAYFSLAKNHSAFLTVCGKVFAFGSNSHFQLGMSTDSRLKSITSPTQIKLLENIKIKSIASGYYHMIALDIQGNLYSWGLSLDGQCGSARLSTNRYPQKLEYFESMEITSISVSSFWNFAVSSRGNIFVWGYCDIGGWLGLNPPKKYSLPYVEIDVSSKEVIQFVGNSCRTIDSDYSVLLPTRVRNLYPFHVKSVRCGGAHTILMCSSRDSIGVNTQKFLYSNLLNLENRKIDINSSLIECCQRGLEEECKYLLRNGANVNFCDIMGNTPLITACQFGLVSIILLLLEHKSVNINAKNNFANSAIHYCFELGLDDIGDILIQRGADEYTRNSHGLTCYEGLHPLHCEEL